MLQSDRRAIQKAVYTMEHSSPAKTKVVKKARSPNASSTISRSPSTNEIVIKEELQLAEEEH